MCVALLWTTPACPEEPRGFLDRLWGTPWDASVIPTLPGCDGQGDIVTDVEGVIAEVVQPECVGYRLSDSLTVNLILLYPDMKWHRLKDARIALRTLSSDWPLWALTPTTADRLQRSLERIERLELRRRLYGDAEPAFPHMAEVFDLADPARGLQGYQINFPSDRYAIMKSALIGQLGPPTTQTMERTDATAPREVLEWSGERTVAVMKEYGSVDASGYFAIVTRDYRDLLSEYKQVTAPNTRKNSSQRDARAARRNPSPYPWFLELIEAFSWAGEDP